MEATTNEIAAGGLMSLLMLVGMVLLSGLIVGALARLFLPGPDPMSWGRTILFGIGGSLLGGLVFELADYLAPMPRAVSLFFSVAGAAFLIWFRRRRKPAAA